MRRQPLLLSCIVFSCNIHGQVTQEDVLIRNDTAFSSKNKEAYTGTYVEFYPGDVKFRGAYFHGLKHGEFLYYNPWPFRDPTGYCQLRRPDSLVHYSMGKRNGIKETYHATRTKEPFVESSENYKNDVLDGECNYWHSSGQLESSIVYKMGKKIKEVEFPVDQNIRTIDFHFADFVDDTIHLRQLKQGDSLRAVIVGYGVSGDSVVMISLREKGFRVKSFVVAMQSTLTYFEMARQSEFLNDYLMTRIRRENGGRFYISKLILVDPHGKEYRMPSKVFEIRE